jgi:acetyl esterase/lipase
MPFLAGCSRLGAFNAVLSDEGGTELAGGSIAYADGPRARLDIYRPSRNGDGAARPVIFFVYGGSWSSGSRRDYAFVGRAFAARGYVTVIADYRLVPAVRYPAFLEDGAAALAWTHTNIASYGGNPDLIFAAGHSAGAYNAVMLAMEPRLLAAAGSDRAVIRATAGLSGPYDFLPLDSRSTRNAFGEAQDLAATQPVNLPTAGVAPMLLATGDADTLVEPRHTRALAAHLEAGGRTVTTRIYEGLSHADTLLAISQPLRGRAPVLEDMDGFFRSVAPFTTSPDRHI